MLHAKAGTAYSIVNLMISWTHSLQKYLSEIIWKEFSFILIAQNDNKIPFSDSLSRNWK